MITIPLFQPAQRIGRLVMQWVATHCMTISYRQPDKAHAINGEKSGVVDGTAHIESFEAFFFQYERQIIGYLWRMTGDENIARDLCQETFLRAWQQFNHVRAYDSPKAWLFRVATNLALNDIRARSRVQHFSLLDDHVLMGSTHDATTEVGEREIIRQILQALPAKQRAVLVLRSVYGCTWEELGHTLGMSKHALQKSLFRAREQFRARYLRKEQ